MFPLLALLLALLVLTWNPRILVPGFALFAVGFAWLMSATAEDPWPALVGIGLVPVLGSLAFGVSGLLLGSSGPAFGAPSLSLRILGVAGIAAAGFALPVSDLIPFLPPALHETDPVRLLLLAALSGALMLGLSESPLDIGYGFLTLVLPVNALMHGAYGNTAALMWLLNALELVTLMPLVIQFLEIQFRISQLRHESHA